VWEDCFTVDFRPLTLTPSLVKMLKSHNCSLDLVRALLRTHYTVLLTLFHYYACTATTFTAACIKANSWTKLLTNLKLLVKTKGAFGITAKVWPPAPPCPFLSPPPPPPL
jgi:hypothetical protein